YRYRPELNRMLDQLRDGDIVAVWKLDRLARSTRNLLEIVETIGNAGARFQSIFRALGRHDDTRRQNDYDDLRRYRGVRARPHPRTHRDRPRRRTKAWRSLRGGQP